MPTLNEFEYPIYYLEILKRLNEPKGIRQLEKETGLNYHKIYNALKNLEIDGVVSRRDTRKEKLYYLTEKGYELLRKLRVILVE
ncbi:winged helix-turn-helix domain-containing protein [Saccharolobus islandicus]|uniref:winged helix-turn-helix domain-containing protein n=1 Tax=Saccharolobus islandicus TaxID=43080 RepID=UPI00035EBEE5|nr:winged helix-turn-helix domain-containing protein [Sulfolobus islandicus]